MLKRIMLLAVLVAALLPSLHAQAGGDWFGYVYNVQTFELIRVHLNGAQNP